MVSEAWFLALVALVAVQRLFELRLSREHEKLIRARGGREHAPEQLVWMTLLHGAWLVAAPTEVCLAGRPFHASLALPASALFLCGQTLRYAAIRDLGERWCVKVFSVPGEVPVRDGVYSVLRHPNYLGVTLEIAALPLLHGAWVTAVVASALNAALLVARVRVEEAALTVS